jgi:hypothetical protein
MSQQDQYASAYYGGKTTFLQWKQKHEMMMEKEEAEDTIRQFLSTFQEMFPQQFEDILKNDPDARDAARMFGKGD